MLGMPLDFSSNINHKQHGFVKTLPEKDLEFVPGNGDGIFKIYLNLMLPI